MMSRSEIHHIVVIGAGAAGLMAARELARAGRRVTVLEARDRMGGRILSLPADAFGYRAEGGAEFVHGEAPVTRGLLREAGLSEVPLGGSRWTVEDGRLSREASWSGDDRRLHAALTRLTHDMTVAAFLRRHFATPADDGLRQSIEQMVEGYDAADPERASILALRDEWMDGGHGEQVRIVGGYGPLIDHLAAECRGRDVALRFAAAASAIETAADGVTVRCSDGNSVQGDAVILTVPLPLLEDIALPAAARDTAASAGHIGFGNVIKILLRFDTCWWVDLREGLADLTFLITGAPIPVWWTQHPADLPVLTGWFGGPRTKSMAGLGEQELIELGLASLAGAFGDGARVPRPVAACAIDWSRDRFARGAYSYATPDTRAAQERLSRGGGPVLFSGEALYRGRDMGTVEAALASGLATARTLLQG